MDVFPVNWDSVPEAMNKEQFFRICHISKSTALHLLKSGKVPCEWSGKKTRCYKIRKEDVSASHLLPVCPLAMHCFPMRSIMGFLE